MKIGAQISKIKCPSVGKGLAKLGLHLFALFSCGYCRAHLPQWPPSRYGSPSFVHYFIMAAYLCEHPRAHPPQWPPPQYNFASFHQSEDWK